MRTDKKIKIVSVCTYARGGMRAVLESFYAAGVLDSTNDPILWTHIEGSTFKKLMQYISTLACLLKIIALNRKMILIHCHTSMRGSYWRKTLVCLIGRALGVPVFMHMHGSEFKSFYSNHGLIGKFIISKTLSCASKVIVLSDSWKDFYSKLVDKNKILVLPNFVKVPEPAICEKINTPEQNQEYYHRMLFLGYVGVRKGIYDLIDAVALNAKYLDKLKIIVGGNGEIDKAKEYAITKGVSSNFEFLGWIGPEEKANLLKSSNSFILPSRNEGLPVSILEAMSYGLPVISTNVGAVASLYSDANNYWLVEARDIKTLSERIVSLTSDDSTGHLIGQHNRILIKKFYSEDVIIPLLREAYNEFSQKK